MKYVRNTYGIVVKKCCASCIHRHLQGKGANVNRICDAGEGLVNSGDLCADWAMEPSLHNAGKGDGAVKSEKYINYLKKELPNGDFSVGNTDRLRTQYKREYGDIYDSNFTKVI